MKHHEYADLFPMLSDEELNVIVEDMRQNGYDASAPIVTLKGEILDGRNRYKAAQLAGVVPVFVEYDGDDPLGYVIRHNLKRRHLNESQRAVIAAKLANMTKADAGRRGGLANANLHLLGDDKISQAEAAALLNVSPRTVATVKAIERAAPEMIEKINAGEMTAHEAKKKIDEQLRPHVAYNSGENEWYTPPEYIEAARAVMGRIDLDPASTDTANKTVKASRYYTKQDNGLEKYWAGKVWMNPPYSSNLIGLFVEKYVEHVRNGDISEGIVLVNNATETQWFYDLQSVSNAIAFPAGRIRFLDVHGNPGAPLQGQAILYYGRNVEKFIKHFGEFGWTAIIHKEE